MITAMIDLAGFIAEATKLARPSVQLRPGGTGEPRAYWHGNVHDGLVACLRVEDKWLDIFTSWRRDGWVEVRDVPQTSDTPLFAHTVLSLPPIDVVFMRGSPEVEAHLTRVGWRRDWPYNDNCRDPVANAYNRHWQTTCPLYGKGTYAVCGGWPVPWPDDDFAEWIDSDLVLWTLEEAEPWVEVFRRDGQYHVLKRVT
jgi:hypothetical protein